MAYFEDLEVWQDAKALTISIYQLMKDNRDYGFRDQIQRAAVSIMNNIAEGSESGSNASNVKFLNIAKGSCAEVRSMLYLANDLNYCTKEATNELVLYTRKISAYLNRLIAYNKNIKQPQNL